MKLGPGQDFQEVQVFCYTSPGRPEKSLGYDFVKFFKNCIETEKIKKILIWEAALGMNVFK